MLLARVVWSENSQMPGIFKNLKYIQLVCRALERSIIPSCGVFENDFWHQARSQYLTGHGIDVSSFKWLSTDCRMVSTNQVFLKLMPWKKCYDNQITLIKLCLETDTETHRTRLLRRVTQPEKRWRLTVNYIESFAHLADYELAFDSVVSRCAVSPLHPINTIRKKKRHATMLHTVNDALEVNYRQERSHTIQV